MRMSDNLNIEKTFAMAEQIERIQRKKNKIMLNSHGPTILE